MKETHALPQLQRSVHVGLRTAAAAAARAATVPTAAGAEAAKRAMCECVPRTAPPSTTTTSAAAALLAWVELERWERPHRRERVLGAARSGRVERVALAVRGRAHARSR